MDYPVYIPSKNSQQIKKKEYESDAGQNILFTDSVSIYQGKTVVELDIQSEIPAGYYGWVTTRSSAQNKGLIINGIIDSDYRGKWKLVVWNISKEDYRFKKGDSIAQIIIQPFLNCYFSEVERELIPTQRGINGFGSTDK